MGGGMNFQKVKGLQVKKYTYIQCLHYTHPHTPPHTTPFHSPLLLLLTMEVQAAAVVLLFIYGSVSFVKCKSEAILS